MADFFKSIIPPNPVAAAANDQILPLVFFTVVFAFALARVGGENRQTALSFFQAIGDAMLRVIGWVLWLAPIGVLALAFTVGAGAGGSALGAVAHYVVLVSVLGLVVTIGALLVGLLLARVPPRRLFGALVGPAAVAVSTRSSLASLPAMLEAARRLGVDEGKADILLPMAVALLRATGSRVHRRGWRAPQRSSPGCCACSSPTWAPTAASDRSPRSASRSRWSPRSPSGNDAGGAAGAVAVRQINEPGPAPAPLASDYYR